MRRETLGMVTAVLVAGLVVGYLAGGGGRGAETITSTETSLSTSVSMTTSTTTTTATVVSTYTENALASSCSQLTNPGREPFPKLFVRTNETALLCARVYYFNPNGTRTLDVSQALYIEAVKYPPNAQPVVFSGASNFTVIPSQKQLVIGGQNNENEGAEVAWALTAMPGASGTYEFKFNSVSYVFVNGEPEDCGSYGQIIAGTGEPSYLNTGFEGCITYTHVNVTTNSTKYTIVTIDGSASQVLMNGAVYFQISGFTNSTQGYT